MGEMVTFTLFYICYRLFVFYHNFKKCLKSKLSHNLKHFKRRGSQGPQWRPGSFINGEQQKPTKAVGNTGYDLIRDAFNF